MARGDIETSILPRYFTCPESLDWMLMNRIALFVLFATMPLICAAGDEVGYWYVNPQVGGVITDSARDVNNDWHYGFGLGRNYSESWSAEINLSDTPRIHDKFDSGHLNLYGATLDLLRVFNRTAAVAPYVSVGAGELRNDPSAFPYSTHFMAQAGGGLIIRLWENADGTSLIALRPEMKARWDDPGHGSHLVDYVGLLGFQFSYGPPKPVPVALPLPPPMAQPAPTPAPAVAAAPVDSDNDGVPDSIDQCPGTPPGVLVDAVGCPLKGSITLEGVNFEFDSSVLTAESLPVLDTVASGLRKHPRLKIELQGHTDSRGTAKYNLALSRRRAEAVRDYLVSRQVPAGQLTAQGYGKTQPIADNATDAGRARNRRVVMLVLDNPGEVEIKGTGQAN